MKLFIIIAINILSFCTLQAQTKTHEVTLENTILMIQEVSTDYNKTLALAKDFEQLSIENETDWLSNYYSAYCYAIAAFLQADPSKIDALADKADILIDKANALHSNDSEISCVKSLIASARIMVNPNARGQQYGMLASQALQKAKFQNPENPRVYFLEAQSLMYMPEAYGGGCKNAQHIMLVAKKKFASYKTDNPLLPHWGYQELLDLMKTCN